MRDVGILISGIILAFTAITTSGRVNAHILMENFRSKQGIDIEAMGLIGNSFDDFIFLALEIYSLTYFISLWSVSALGLVHK